MTAAPWFCEAHRRWTTSDCLACDAEQIADLERYGSLPSCHTCGRTLAAGESAYADDWKVVTPEGVRAETRYTCEGCAR